MLLKRQAIGLDTQKYPEDKSFILKKDLEINRLRWKKKNGEGERKEIKVISLCTEIFLCRSKRVVTLTLYTNCKAPKETELGGESDPWS